MASPSPATQSSGVSVSATVNFNNTSVTINSQDIADLKSKGLVFSISNPVDMGSFADLITWMKDNLGLDVSAETIQDDIDGLPEPFSSALSSFYNADIKLTTLNINTNTNTYAAGATISPNPPLNLLNILTVEQIGIQVASVGKSGSPASP